MAAFLYRRIYGCCMAWSVAIAGTARYIDGKVLRLFTAHPEVEVGTLIAASSVGSRPGEHYPHLLSLADHAAQPTEAEILAEYDVAILTPSHGVSGTVATALEELTSDGGSAPLLIDYSADYRLIS